MWRSLWRPSTPCDVMPQSVTSLIIPKRWLFILTPSVRRLSFVSLWHGVQASSEEMTKNLTNSWWKRDLHIWLEKRNQDRIAWSVNLFSFYTISFLYLSKTASNSTILSVSLASAALLSSSKLDPLFDLWSDWWRVTVVSISSFVDPFRSVLSFIRDNRSWGRRRMQNWAAGMLSNQCCFIETVGDMLLRFDEASNLHISSGNNCCHRWKFNQNGNISSM